MMNRRGFLKAILAAGVAPYVCTTGGILMPVNSILLSDDVKLIIPNHDFLMYGVQFTLMLKEYKEMMHIITAVPRELIYGIR